MSRSLAAKASLATRVDAFGEEASFELGATHKVKLEARLRLLEEGNLRKLSGTGKAKAQFEKYRAKSEVFTYQPEVDSTLSVKKRKHSESAVKQEEDEEDAQEEPETPTSKPRKIKDEAEVVSSEKKKKKKKKNKQKDAEASETPAKKKAKV